MKSVLALSLVALFAVLFGGADATVGPIQSCQPQLLNIIPSSINLESLTPSCLQTAIPALINDITNLLNSNNGRSTCTSDISSLRSIMSLLQSRLRLNSPLCGLNLNSLNINDSQVPVNLLGLATVNAKIENVVCRGLGNLAATVSLLDVFPAILKVDVTVPLNIDANVNANLGLSSLLNPITSLNVTIKAITRIALLVKIGQNGAVTTVQVAEVGSSVNDYYCSPSLLNLSNLGNGLSVVSTIANALTKAIGVLLGKIVAALITGCVTPCTSCVG